MTERFVYCIPNAPHQKGDLWVEVTPNLKVRAIEPTTDWWRDREFTIEEFRDIINVAKE